MIAPGQFYRHYKNGIVYRVLTLAVDTETQLPMVVYQDTSNESKIWTRSRTMFEEKVEWEGSRVKRFMREEV